MYNVCLRWSFQFLLCNFQVDPVGNENQIYQHWLYRTQSIKCCFKCPFPHILHITTTRLLSLIPMLSPNNNLFSSMLDFLCCNQRFDKPIAMSPKLPCSWQGQIPWDSHPPSQICSRRHYRKSGNRLVFSDLQWVVACLLCFHPHQERVCHVSHSCDKQ